MNQNFALNVKDFGAEGDGRSLDTKAIQAAIDKCEKNGGGTVLVPPGNYLSGAINLCDNLTFQILTGATIIGTKDEEHFEEPDNYDALEATGDTCAVLNYGLLKGNDIGNIRIVGGGNLDDQRHKRGGPKPIALKECYDITIKDINIYNSPHYAVNLGNCEIALIENVRINYSNAD